jgi:RecB family exonuclease
MENGNPAHISPSPRPDDRGIVARLTAEFCRLPPAKRPRHIVLLPTKNLVERFHYRLTRDCGTTLLPATHTISTFIATFGQVYSRAAGGALRRLLFQQAVAAAARTHFAPGSETELLHLWDDLTAAGFLDQSTFDGPGLAARLTARLAPTWTRSAAYAEYLGAGIEEMAAIFARYRELLAARRLEDPHLLARCQLDGAIANLPRLARRYAFIVADIHDAPPVQLRLLATLAGLNARFLFSGFHFRDHRRLPPFIAALPPDQVEWCSPPPPLLLECAAGHTPTTAPVHVEQAPAIIQEHTGTRKIGAGDNSGDNGKPTDTIIGLTYPTLTAECRAAVYRALELVDSGVEPADIAIVVGDLHRCRELLYSMVTTLPASRRPLDQFAFNLKRSLRPSGVCRFFEALIRWCGAAPVSAALVLELTESPLFATLFLSGPKANHPLSLTALRRLVNGRVITALDDLEQLAARRSEDPLQPALAALWAAARALPAAASAADYARRLAEMLAAAGDTAAGPFEHAAREHLAGLLAELAQDAAADTAAANIDLAALHHLFTALTAAEETGLNYDYLSGIQVLDLRDAKGITCRHLLLIGNHEGSFLGRPPKESFFTPTQRHLLGIPTPAHEEILQRYTVYSLLAGCRETWLTHAREVGDRQLGANIFFCELEHAGMPTLLGPHPTIAGRPPVSAPPPLPAPGSDPGRLMITMPPTRLGGHQANHLFTCPARCAFELLDLPQLELPEEGLEPLGEGQLAHRICEQLGRELPGPADPPALAAALRAIIARLPRTAEIHFLLTELDCRGAWDQLAACLGKDNSRCEAVEEWVEADISALVGRPLVGVGKIDRRDLAAGTRRLIDFKRKTIPGKKALEELREVQLLFYALLLAEKGTRVDTIVYHAIMPPATGSGNTSAAIDPLLPRFIDRLRLILDDIAQGGYPRQPSRDCGLCPYAEICLTEAELETWT